MWLSKLFGNKKDTTGMNTDNAIIDNTNIHIVIRTDHGNIRDNNEDAALYFRVADQQVTVLKGTLLIVADGMGGHQAGEVASNMATEIISREYFREKNNTSVEKCLRKSFETANNRIYRLASTTSQHKGMGTTCTAIVLTDDAISFAQVGDSRAYVSRNGIIERITRDQTQVQELVDLGEISEAEAAVHPKRNILTNAMGTKASLTVVTGNLKPGLEAGDRVLLCSDGLYDYFNDNEIGEILISGELEQVADTFIAGAKSRGGHDNITVILAAFRQPARETAVKDTRDIQLPVTKEYNLP